MIFILYSCWWWRGKKIKELHLGCSKLTPQNAATIIKSLPDEIENLDLCENDFSGDVEGLANALCGKKIKKLNLVVLMYLLDLC